MDYPRKGEKIFTKILTQKRFLTFFNDKSFKKSHMIMIVLFLSNMQLWVFDLTYICVTNIF